MTTSIPDQSTEIELTPFAWEYISSRSDDYEIVKFIKDAVIRADYMELALEHVAGERNIPEIEEHDRPAELDGKITAKYDTPRNSALYEEYNQPISEMLVCRVVDNFQVYLEEMVKGIIEVCPDTIRGRSYEIEFGELLDAPDLETLIEDRIQRMADELSYQGVHDMERWFNERGIEMIEDDTARHRMEEFIATRNIIVHNRAEVDARYKSRSPYERFDSGEHRTLDLLEVVYGIAVLDDIVVTMDQRISEKFDDMDVSTDTFFFWTPEDVTQFISQTIDEEDIPEWVEYY
jgi:hypothetical protein